MAPDAGGGLPGFPLLFLSHAGIDTEPARALKRRLEAAPDAQAAKLCVWLDKDGLNNDGLMPGRPWQEQLEEAIEKHATAFAVYVGSRGVVNWVEAEVRLALSRAMTSAGRFPFVPVIAAASLGSAALPGFARQYHGVRDVENDAGEFQKLLAAVLGRGEAGGITAEAEPFFGLRAIDEKRSHLFFGRQGETEALVERLRATRLIMVTGDSGSGKSSLVKAGLLPRWRGGIFAEAGGGQPDDEIWHVVELRPGSNPSRALGEAVMQAAALLERSADDQGTYFKWATGSDSDLELRRQGLRCGLEAARTRTLLVVDQFEELVTLTPKEQRRPFIELLLELADPGDPAFAVVLTMRRDYYNLLSASECQPLYDRLQASNRAALYRLGRMSEAGLREIVTEPLRLAGVSPKEREDLANAVLQEVSERPGDLALVQFALTRAWERRSEFGNNMLAAYTGVGGVDGALAREADRVFNEVLGGKENEAEITATLIRLARVQGTAGPTRRVARRREFSESRWAMLQKLADMKGNRLVLIGGRRGEDASGEEPDETAEISHEALLTRWPRLHAWLSEAPDDKRTLDRLTDRAAEWADAATSDAKARLLARTDAERDAFALFMHDRPAWLSDEEKTFVEASVNDHEQEESERENLLSSLKEALTSLKSSFSRATKLRNRALLAAGLAAVMALVAGYQAYAANKERLHAQHEQRNAVAAAARADEARQQAANDRDSLAQSKREIERQLAIANAAVAKRLIAELQLYTSDDKSVDQILLLWDLSQTSIDVRRIIEEALLQNYALAGKLGELRAKLVAALDLRWPTRSVGEGWFATALSIIEMNPRDTDDMDFGEISQLFLSRVGQDRRDAMLRELLERPVLTIKNRAKYNELAKMLAEGASEDTSFVLLHGQLKRIQTDDVPLIFAETLELLSNNIATKDKKREIAKLLADVSNDLRKRSNKGDNDAKFRTLAEIAASVPTVLTAYDIASLTSSLWEAVARLPLGRSGPTMTALRHLPVGLRMQDNERRSFLLGLLGSGLKGTLDTRSLRSLGSISALLKSDEGVAIPESLIALYLDVFSTFKGRVTTDTSLYTNIGVDLFFVTDDDSKSAYQRQIVKVLDSAGDADVAARVLTLLERLVDIRTKGTHEAVLLAIHRAVTRFPDLVERGLGVIDTAARRAKNLAQVKAIIDIVVIFTRMSDDPPYSRLYRLLADIGMDWPRSGDESASPAFEALLGLYDRRVVNPIDALGEMDLVYALVKVAERLSAEEADQVASQLLDRAAAGSFAGKANLFFVVSRLDLQGPRQRQLVSSLLTATAEESGMDVCSFHSLVAALFDRMPPNEAPTIRAELSRHFDSAADTNARYCIALAASYNARTPAGVTNELARIVWTAIQENRKSQGVVALITNAILGDVPRGGSDRQLLWEILVEQLGTEADVRSRLFIFQLLNALVAPLPPDRQQQAMALLPKIGEALSSDLFVRTSALDSTEAIAHIVYGEHRKEVSDRLRQMLAVETDSNSSTRVVTIWADLLDRSSPTFRDQLVDTIKFPTLSQDAREVLLDRLIASLPPPLRKLQSVEDKIDWLAQNHLQPSDFESSVLCPSVTKLVVVCNR